MQGFTLRGCARRAGVSHAAPAHHFADVTALLTEMAAIGFERLTEAMRERRRQAPADARAQFVASGEGYIAFALQNPQHFALMFGRAGLDRANPRLAAAGRAAFGELLDVVAGITGAKDPLGERRGRRDVMFAWSFVHGFAKLRVEKQARNPHEGKARPRSRRTLRRWSSASFCAIERDRGREQASLLPPRVEDYVGSDNPVRAIESYVGALDLAKLGFRHAERGVEVGQPPYDPADLLKLYLYGYLNQVRSSRRLEREASAQSGADLAAARGLRPATARSPTSARRTGRR